MQRALGIMVLLVACAPQPQPSYYTQGQPQQQYPQQQYPQQQQYPPQQDPQYAQSQYPQQPQYAQSQQYPQPQQPAGAHFQLWMGIRQTGIGSSYSAGVGWYVLFDDGRVLPYLPSQGLDAVDENALAADLGSYRASSDGVAMQFQQYTPVFTKRSDGGYDSREGSFWPIDPLDGALLDGAYASRTGPPDVAFAPNGQFQSSGGLLINSGGNGLVPTPAGSGTYRIARNTLYLSFTTGQIVRISITTMHANELPRASSIYFGGFEYHRT